MRRLIPALMLLLLQVAGGKLYGQGSGGGKQQPAAAPAAAAAQAAVPRLIMFSGTLRDLAGKPVTGTVDVTFGLYAEETDGTPLWYETQTLQTDSLGHYNVMLGAMSPAGVPMELFTSGQAHWLGVQVASLPEMSRVLLVSVPYAMKAGDSEMLGGKPASDYVLSSQAGSQAVSSAAAAATLSGFAKSAATATTTSSESPVTQATTQNYIPVFSDSIGTLTNSIMTQSGTKIGVNTSSPAFNLDVNGNAVAIGTKTAAAGQGGTLRFRDDAGTNHWLFGLPGSAGSQDFQMYNYTNGHAPVFIENGAPSYSFYFSGSGNVGVLTNSPAFPLDVNGNVFAVGTKTAKPGYGGTVRFRDDTGTVRWAMGLPGSGGATNFFLSNLVNSTTPFYIEATAPSNTIYLKSTGNVGIGTPTPAQRLSVAGIVESTSGGFKFPDGSTQTTAGTGVATDLNCVACVSSAETSFNYAASTVKGGDASNSLLLNGLASSAFQPAGSYPTLGGTNAFTGNNSIAGSLGVGTTSPVSTLHVLTSGTTPQANSVLAGDAIGGECSSSGCAGADAVSQGSTGVGIYAASSTTGADAGTGIYAETYDTTNGWSGTFNGDIQLYGGIYAYAPGGGIFLVSPNGSKCAWVTLDNTVTGQLNVTSQTCPASLASKRVMRQTTSIKAPKR